MGKSILKSKWFAVFELVTTLAVVGIAILMVAGRGPAYEEVQKTYNSMVEDLRMRNTSVNRYTLYAQQAGSEGNTVLQKLYTAAADGQKLFIEQEFAMVNSLSERTMPVGDSVEAKSTAENLTGVIGEERNKAESVYPRYAANAAEEGYKEAEELFDRSGKAAKVNEELFSLLSAELTQNGRLNYDTPVYLCEECGTLAIKEKPESCSACGKSGTELKEY